MRILTGLLAVVLFAGVPFSAPAASYSGGPAPADEYFGPHHQSILEIRNRLNHFDEQTNREMLEPGVVVQLDDLASSIGDWRHQYPADPWLPHAYACLLRDYHRAGAASTSRATVALDEMKASYPDSPETSATVAMIYGNESDTPTVSMFAAVSPANVGPAVAAPAAIVVPAVQSAPSGAWARFDAMRSGTASDGP